ncbi:MAG: prepilin-type N-terminal cleavage/methylation domain-containing protein [Deferribacteraceae bacterium]|jgi:prepilin-type N-terminal cleavage/methylation domain-containing protein|nr:prepilin-type N-terminal cleavage/methylation domain-containing protein [Deferribacteraceae bacterium]
MRKGFTLVELSIVMVVIGLLIGMALKGKSLLESATIRSEVNKLSLMQSAVAALLSTSSGDGSLNELPMDNSSKSYHFIENSFLVNKGLLSYKDISYNNKQHEILFCKYKSTADPSGPYVEDDADPSDNMLCAFTPDNWPLKFHCVAEAALDDQDVKEGKGRSGFTSMEVGGVNQGELYDCNKSEKKIGRYSYILLSSRIVR